MLVCVGNYMEKCDREIKSESEFYCKNMESSGVYWNNKIDLSALDFNYARYICLVIEITK